jgi:putative hydrolase of HD superfamily
MEGLPHESALKSLAMATFHDLPEARTGDMDFVAKHYTSVDEERAVVDQFSGFEFGEDLKKLIEVYEIRTSLEAKCAKDADSLEQLYQEWVLMWQGNKLAQKWYESDYKDRVPGLRTESAKKLAYEMKDSNPQEWWWSQFVKDDMAIDKEKLIGKR